MRILLKTLLTLCVWQLMYLSSEALPISAQLSSTASICYNDGTLIVVAAGGTAPYSYQITAGPANPNLSYPITIPAGSNTFVNLPHGSYTVLVTDAAGAMATVTGMVSGSYQFPNMLLDTNTAALIVAYASGGLPPYQYALSMTSANAGFGPYQNSDSFKHLCPGAYWVRVRDSCHNIFTNEAYVSYRLKDSVLCVNFSKGHLSVVGMGGNPPYSYTFGSMHNSTGVFSGLPAYFSDSLVIKDSCGVSYKTTIGVSSFGFTEVCPFDSNLYISGSSLPDHSTLTFVCTDCIPVQTVVSTSLSHSGQDVVFQHILPNHNYHIVVTSSACGGDTLPVTISRPAPSYFTIGSAPLSCNSFQVTSNYPFDSVILRNAAGVLIGISRPGDFFRLPAGSYTATAYTHSSSLACFLGDSSQTTVSVPYFPPTCEALVRDSACGLMWELIVASDASLYDSYSLIYRPGDTVRGAVDPSYYAYFYHLNPGIYTLVSDSGCAESVMLDTVPTFHSTAVSYLPCVGLPSISAHINSPPNTCATYQRLELFQHDTPVHYTAAADGSLIVADSGWYQVRWYLQSYDAQGHPFRYDSICPIDSNNIFVSNSHIPTPSSNTAYECTPLSTDSVRFQIFGGFIPYTVEVPGFDTLILQTNEGVFPTNAPGQYSMIVYDSCGVSRSVTFSIIDICTSCPTVAVATTDSVFCAGDTVRLSSISTGAVSYLWLVNGQPYSVSADTLLIAGTGVYHLLLRCYSLSGCKDSAALVYTGQLPYSIHLGGDTSYCDTFRRVLSSGIGSTLWSTGQTGAQITVDTAGSYWALVSNRCGVKRDTTVLRSTIVSDLQLQADHTVLCRDRTDTVLLHASIDSASRDRASFVWTGGQVDSPVYSALLSAHAAGQYQVTVMDGDCHLSKSIVLTSIVCDSTDTTAVTDTSCVHKMVVPNAFSPNNDHQNETFHVLHTCTVYSFSLHIYDRWGQLVYESTDIDQGWDGTYGGVAQPSEVYSWWVCMRAKESTVNTCTMGQVTLLR